MLALTVGHSCALLVCLIAGLSFMQEARAGRPVWCKVCESSKESPECVNPVRFSDVASGEYKTLARYRMQCDDGCAQQVYTVHGQLQHVSFGCAGIDYAPYGVDLKKCPSQNDGKTWSSRDGRVSVTDCLICNDNDCNDPKKNSPLYGVTNSWRAGGAITTSTAAPSTASPSDGKKRLIVYPINARVGNLTLELLEA